MSFLKLLRAFCALSMIAVAAQQVNAASVLPPHSTIDGKSIGDWTADWWTWAMQAPVAQDPLADTSGAFAQVNNGGPVFFVAGTNGSIGSTSRAFNVPAGRPLLVPLINFFDTEPSILDGGAPRADRERAANVVVDGWVGSVDSTSLFASIDGTAITDLTQHLEITGLFSMGSAQADSVITSLGVSVGDVLDPTKAAGYWLMLDGLAPGSVHTLHLGGMSNSFTPEPNCCTNLVISAFSQDNTITITVVPEPATVLLWLTGLSFVFGLQLSQRERQGLSVRTA